MEATGLQASIGAVPATASVRDRLAGVDALRGLAIVLMISYHCCYDLAYFGFASWTTSDMLTRPAWIAWRSLIVAGFLVLVGLSRVLGSVFKPSASDFRRRWAQVAGGALLVSLASYGFAGERWIYFGVLHFIAVALLLCQSILMRVRAALLVAVAGGLALAAGLLFSTSALDPAPLNILGFAAHKPPTEDYVPLFPWIGVVLVGLAGGLGWKSRDFAPLPALSQLRAIIPGPLQGALAKMGRWSLSIYLLHQPVLMGVFTVAAGVVRSRVHS